MTTSYQQHDGRLTRIVDRTGHVHATLTWADGRLARLVAGGVTIDGAIIADPLLGEAQRIGPTTMSRLDWHHPTEIPAIAAPGALPPGAGSAVMNVIAILARRAGVSAMRYAGPYPTHALWTTLARSFRTTASEDDFTRDALVRMARVARDPIPVDFVPAPHDRVATPHGHVELRDGLERARIDGLSYDWDAPHHRLVRGDDDTIEAELAFGGKRWSLVARFHDDGRMRGGVEPIRESASPMVGRRFPLELVETLADVVAEHVPAPLGPAARAYVTNTRMIWAELGRDALRVRPTVIAIHAGLWERVAPLGLAALARELVTLLVPFVTHEVVRSVDETR